MPIRKSESSVEGGTLDKLLAAFVWYCLWVSLIILFIGVLGNATICYVIARTKDLRTSVNYYLFSLALADILSSITWLVFAVIWILDVVTPELREVIWNFHDAITSVDANLTVAALSINRFIAICYPLKTRYLNTQSRTIKIITAIWIFSFLYLIAYHLLKLKLCQNKENTFCNIVFFMFSDKVYVILFILLPMITITTCYILIGLSIWKSYQASGTSHIHNPSDRKVSGKRGLKLTVAVILEFFVCSIPCQLVQISGLLFPKYLSTTSGHALFFSTKILSLFSTLIDPIVYSLVSTKFKKAFLDLYNSSGKESITKSHTEVIVIDNSSSGSLKRTTSK